MENSLYKNTNFWDPLFYLKHAIPQFELAKNALKQYPLKGNERILDIGCGPGNISAELALQVPKGQVIGIDISQNMIAFAQKNHHHLKNLSFEQKDAIEFSFKQPFDVVVSFNTLQWVTKQIAALRNIYAHLKSGGRLQVILTRPQIKVDPINEVMIPILQEPAWRVYFKDFVLPDYLIEIPIEQYQRALIETGFKIDYFSEYDYVVKYSQKEELANWFQSWMAHRLALPPEKRETFFLHVVDKYLAYMGKKEDQIEYHHYVWEYAAHK
ncbi:MAG: class I SAM-dependent methyltransferase [Proteobacteria bacterium]|nr:class I SAM-dependent methyltransferase [Pseudomonadota bacterium]